MNYMLFPWMSKVTPVYGIVFICWSTLSWILATFLLFLLQLGPLMCTLPGPLSVLASSTHFSLKGAASEHWRPSSHYYSRYPFDPKPVNGEVVRLVILLEVEWFPSPGVTDRGPHHPAVEINTWDRIPLVVQPTWRPTHGKTHLVRTWEVSV